MISSPLKLCSSRVDDCAVCGCVVFSQGINKMRFGPTTHSSICSMTRDRVK